MFLLKSNRLLLREINLKDADFIYRLMNDPAWLQNIGDRNIHSVKDAEAYIESKIFTSYQENGFGFYVIELLDSKKAVGSAGLVNREGLDHIDIGYALLPDYRGFGYAFEATKLIYEYGTTTLGLDKIVAIVNPENQKSIHLLEKLGLEFERMVVLPDTEEQISLYS